MTKELAGAASAELGDGLEAVDPADVHGRLGTRNERILFVAIGGYIALLSALMLVRGVSLTPDVILIGLGLAAVLLGRGRLFLRDWVPFIGLFFAYELMRGYADNFGAEVHVGDVLAVERLLSFGVVPTEMLQDWLHPATGVDLVAVAATIFYFLHFPLPLAVGFFLWLRHRRVFYDFVAALIVLSMAGFATYLVLPVAPPWWAAEHGVLVTPSGAPAVEYLKEEGFTALARAFGFEGSYLYSYTIYEINPNPVAAFPSLHAAYPFLAWLFARRTFGRIHWLMLVYTAAVWFSIVYLADHYVVDIYAGVAYAIVAFWVVLHAPARARRFVDRAADEELEAGVEASDATGDRGPLASLGRRVRWPVVGQGMLVFGAGIAGALVIAQTGVGGGVGSPVYLLPWLAILGGLWRAAAGLVSR